ncbi:hypothetical protein HK102_013236 [Quaeritorhiza haematococci]|nr:hypothetical protein HK102_013236 [Quaeritorhiza haematococci]
MGRLLVGKLQKHKILLLILAASSFFYVILPAFRARFELSAEEGIARRTRWEDGGSDEPVKHEEESSNEIIDEYVEELTGNNQVRAAIVYFLQKNAQSRTVHSLYVSLRRLFDHFNNHAAYPVFIFVEDFSTNAQADLLLKLTLPDPKVPGRVGRLDRVRFFPIKLDFPAGVETDPDKLVPLYKDQWPQKNHITYWWFDAVFSHPAIVGLDYIWLIEPDTYLESDIQYDPFDAMQSYNVSYAYGSTKKSPPDDVMLLWDLTAGYLTNRKRRNAGRRSLQQIVQVPPRQKRMDADMMAYETHYEFLHVPTFRLHHGIREFTKQVLESNGIYLYGWPIGPLRWLTVNLNLNMDSTTMHFCDIDYNNTAIYYPRTCTFPSFLGPDPYRPKHKKPATQRLKAIPRQNLVEGIEEDSATQGGVLRRRDARDRMSKRQSSDQDHTPDDERKRQRVLDDDDLDFNFTTDPVSPQPDVEENDASTSGLMSNSLFDGDDDSEDEEEWEEVFNADGTVVDSPAVSTPQEASSSNSASEEKAEFSIVISPEPKDTTPTMQAIAVSVVPTNISQPLSEGQQKAKKQRKAMLFLNSLRTLSKWWAGNFPVSSPVEVVRDEEKDDTGPRRILASLGRFLELPSDHADRFISCEASVIAFVSACRGLGIETRFVCSLHPVSLSFAGSPSKKRKKSSSATASPQDASTGPEPEDSKVTVVSPLRFWCEIYSPHENRFIAVDPINDVVDNPTSMEPPTTAHKQLQFSYIVAYDAVFGVKDVTQRYTSHFGSVTSRLRVPAGPDGDGWWKRTLWLYSDSGKSERDMVEDSELKKTVTNETMPNNLAGFVNHPLYALERHCKKYELIYPSGKEHAIGQYKGELVYPRSHVKQLRTREGWLKEGRSIKEDEVPCKFTKVRAATINRKRQIEQAKANEAASPSEEKSDPSADPSKSGLFGEWQTDVYKAPPIVDGKIPKNSYGNIEMFHPNMLPPGAAHLRLSGVGKIAKRLGIDYASAVDFLFAPVKVGFEFHHNQSTPVVEGIVVAKEFEELLKEAYQENASRLEQQALEKRQTRVVGRWRRLVLKLLTRERLRRDYMDEDE